MHREGAWERQASEWAQFARSPEHDHFFWGFNGPRFIELVPPAGRLHPAPPSRPSSTACPSFDPPPRFVSPSTMHVPSPVAMPTCIGYVAGHIQVLTDNPASCNKQEDFGNQKQMVTWGAVR